MKESTIFPTIIFILFWILPFSLTLKMDLKCQRTKGPVTFLIISGRLLQKNSFFFKLSLAQNGKRQQIHLLIPSNWNVLNMSSNLIRLAHYFFFHFHYYFSPALIMYCTHNITFFFLHLFLFFFYFARTEGQKPIRYLT